MSVRKRLCSLALLLAVPTVESCGGADCKEYGAPALMVSVLDAHGAPVCDADVVATDGSDVFALEGSSGVPCMYYGAYERAGKYIVTATLGGESAISERISVSSRACHVKSKQVSLTLSP
jgi:hypothetical protein